MKVRHKLTFCRSNAMFAGKSEAARRVMSIADSRFGTKWACIRPDKARRPEDDEGVHRTHSGNLSPCWYTITIQETIFLVQSLIDDGFTLFWIDEPFLWSDLTRLEELVSTLLEHAPIVISSLTATSEGEQWIEISKLLALADEIVQCTDAICVDEKCAARAWRTWYIGGDIKTDKVKAGGASDYIPVCVNCWNARAVGAHIQC